MTTFITGLRSLIRRVARPAALASALMAGAVMAATPIQTQIWNPNSGQWENYDPRRAMRYYEIYGRVPEQFERQVVPFRTAQEPGTIVIDADKHFLYFVLPDHQAVRYGIGVGREGFGWAGLVRVARKAEWPRWTPPRSMVERDPRAAEFADGMPGGPDNPLGARALYLYEGSQDTIYRIHGTPEPWSIGLNVSSGCIRLRNEDIKDLYERVEIGAKVIVLMQGAALYRGMGDQAAVSRQ
jgi:lipoprotein-anchoring transpeptidase ErfK/SrfK